MPDPIPRNRSAHGRRSRRPATHGFWRGRPRQRAREDAEQAGPAAQLQCTPERPEVFANQPLRRPRQKRRADPNSACACTCPRTSPSTRACARPRATARQAGRWSRPTFPATTAKHGATRTATITLTGFSNRSRPTTSSAPTKRRTSRTNSAATAGARQAGRRSTPSTSAHPTKR